MKQLQTYIRRPQVGLWIMYDIVYLTVNAIVK